MRKIRFPFASVLIALAAVLLVCPPAMADEEAAAVKGTVTYNGKALEVGRIFFHVGNDQFVGCKIKDGQYSVDRLPVGDWVITVETKGIPRRYEGEKTTPLKVAVKKGSQTLDIDLTD